MGGNNFDLGGARLERALKHRNVEDALQTTVVRMGIDGPFTEMVLQHSEDAGATGLLEMQKEEAVIGH